MTTHINGLPEKPNHVAALIDMVGKLNDEDVLAGVVVVMAGKDKSFRVVSANNSDWSHEDMILAVKQSLRRLEKKPKLILPN